VERITPRYVFEARIRISTLRGSEDLEMEGWTRDISESGLSAFVARSLMVEELVTLEVPLAGLQRLRIPARVARCLGTQYGFQFTALGPDQRAAIQSAVRNLPQADAGDQMGVRFREHQSESEPKQDTGTNVADRARMLIQRGYTPKVAVELVLHELEVEQGFSPRVMEKARSEAEEFLAKLRRGVI